MRRDIAVILVIMIMIPSLMVFIEGADGDGETVEIGVYEYSGKPFEGAIIDGSKVGFSTEVTSEGIIYAVEEGSDIPLSKPLYLKVNSNIDSQFHFRFKLSDATGWVRDAGIECALSLDGSELASAKSMNDITAQFESEGTPYLFDKDVMYRLSFRTIVETSLDHVPEEIIGITLTYQAEAVVESHYVHFDADGGTIEGESVKEVIYGRPVGILPSAVRNAYDFDGWYTESGRLTSSTIMGHSDIYATAEWTALITVTFDPNGGTVDEDSRIVREGDRLGTLPEPVRDAHSFSGWYSTLEGGSPVTKDDRVGSSDITLYAHWTSAEDIDVHEETYIDDDGNTVYEKDVTTYYADGSIVLEKYIKVTDTQDRVISETHRIESTDADGAVSLVYDTEDTEYLDAGRTVTSVHSESYPDGYSQTSTTVTQYDFKGGIVGSSFNSEERGIDDYGHEYSAEQAWTTEGDDIVTYDYSGSGTLHTMKSGYSMEVEWERGTGYAVFAIQTDTMTADAMEEILSLMERPIAPIIGTISPVISSSSENLTVSADALVMLSESGYSLRASGEAGSLTIDSVCLSQAARSGYDLFLSIEKGTEDNLTPEQLKTVGEGFAVVITMMYGDTPVHEIGGMASIELSPGLDSDRLRLWYVDDIGNTTEVPMSYDSDTGIVSFSVDHFSVYLVSSDASFEMNPMIIAAVSIIFMLILLVIVLKSRHNQKEKA